MPVPAHGRSAPFVAPDKGFVFQATPALEKLFLPATPPVAHPVINHQMHPPAYVEQTYKTTSPETCCSLAPYGRKVFAPNPKDAFAQPHRRLERLARPGTPRQEGRCRMAQAGVAARAFATPEHGGGVLRRGRHAGGARSLRGLFTSRAQILS